MSQEEPTCVVTPTLAAYSIALLTLLFLSSNPNKLCLSHNSAFPFSSPDAILPFVAITTLASLSKISLPFVFVVAGPEKDVEMKIGLSFTALSSSSNVGSLCSLS